MKRRIGSLALALVLALSLAVTAAAEEGTDWTWDGTVLTLRTQAALDEIDQWESYPAYGGAVVVTNQITDLPEGFFSRFPDLERITLEEGIREIEPEVFRGSSAREINLPGSLEVVPERLFPDCYNLERVTLGEGIREIGPEAFRGLHNLREVALPGSLERIGYNAFYDCTALVRGTVTYTGTRQAWRQVQVDNGNGYLSRAEITYITPSDSGTWGETGTWSLADQVLTVSAGSPEAIPAGDQPWAQYYPLVERLRIEEGVSGIGDGAFAGLFDEASPAVSLPVSLRTVGKTAFGTDQRLIVSYAGTYYQWQDVAVAAGNNLDPACADASDSGTWGTAGTWILEGRNLTLASRAKGGEAAPVLGDKNAPWAKYLRETETLTLKEGINGPDAAMLQGATELHSLRIEAKTAIPEGAFADCDQLNSLTLSGQGITVGARAFAGCDRLNPLIIAGQGTTLGDYAFRDCAALMGVYVGDGVTSLGLGSFAGCTRLGSVELPDSLADLGTGAFAGVCPDRGTMENGYYEGSQTPTIRFAGSAARWNALAAQEGSRWLDRADVFVASDWRNEWVESPDGQSSWSWSLNNGCLHIYGSGGNGFALPDFASPADAPWYGCRDQIIRVTLDNGVQRVGANAFAGLPNLRAADLADSGVAALGASAFDGCAGLRLVRLPGTLTSVGENAFRGCDAIREAWVIGEAAGGGGAAPSHQLARVMEAAAPGWAGALSVAAGNEALTGCLHYELAPSRHRPAWELRDNALLLDLPAEGLLTQGFDPGQAPWYACRQDVTEILAGECLSWTVSLGGGGGGSANPNLNADAVGLSVLGRNVFRDLDQVTAVTLPVSLTRVEEGAFSGCDRLETVTFRGTRAQWEAVSIGPDNEPLAKARVICAGDRAEEAAPTVDRVTLGRTEEAVTVTAQIACDEPEATVLCGVYDQDGRMIDAELRPASEGPDCVFRFAEQDANRAEVFLLGGSGAPLCVSGED